MKLLFIVGSGAVGGSGEMPFEHYLRLDNTDLSADEAARIIKEHFDL